MNGNSEYHLVKYVHQKTLAPAGNFQISHFGGRCLHFYDKRQCTYNTTVLSYLQPYICDLTPSSQIKLRSHHDFAHLHHLTNVATKNQPPTPYSYSDIDLTRF